MKILHVEADIKVKPEQPASRWVKREKRKGAEVKVITNVYNNGQELAKLINWCDVLIFNTTFVYMASIQKLLTDVLIKYRKEPLRIIIDNYEVEKNIKLIVEDLSYVWVQKWNKTKGEDDGYHELDPKKYDALAYSMRLFEIIQLKGDNEFIPITFLTPAIKREEKRLAWESEYKSKAPNRPTGRKIKIGDLRSVVGKEWDKLNQGDIVDEIDMSKLDPRKGWGIWVMGATEPVKLIGASDSHGYNEYSIVQ